MLNCVFKKIKNFLHKIINNDYYILLLFSTLSILPLISVYVLEYFFEIQPCKFCIYQRIPFFILSFLPIFFIKIKQHSFKAFFIILIMFGINAGLSFYQVGLENKWFVNTTCKGLSSASKFDNMFLSSGTLLQQCDVVKFRFLTLSLASWNLIYCAMNFATINLLIFYRFIKDDNHG
jgi:disulfide bond formation protein DsbB